ncbi:MAG: tryptophan synthase subunit alpha, partial [Gammaproteobacteria bacterium]|nr:tryptophan synthase subunit alpha [Gammaproteobacteria bacterium]
MLEDYVRARRAQRDVLLMTHIVIGYPNLEQSMRTVEAMVQAGVDLMELQIPFSEPIADGPVILHANQKALTAGVTVEQCFEFAAEASRRFNIPFLFMSYYNILFRRGVQGFAKRMAEIGLRGAIVPDLPPEEAQDYLAAMAS